MFEIDDNKLDLTEDLIDGENRTMKFTSKKGKHTYNFTVTANYPSKKALNNFIHEYLLIVK